jgi:hypothetical protein
MNERVLARITHNTEDWRKPSKKPAGLESSETYSAKHGFGHEEWLFRTEWQIDGWRYAFIEGFNKSRHAYIGGPLDVTLFTFLPENDWIKKRHRYLLYKFPDPERDELERSVLGRRGSQELPDARPLFRRGTKPVQYDPQHEKMQARLMAELRREYGTKHVIREQDFVDVRVETDEELIFFEIKSDLAPRTVIRRALGQILEYAYQPSRSGRGPDHLVIVGRTALGREDEVYLEQLRNRFKLPIAYRLITI